jgi:hypothetical protein
MILLVCLLHILPKLTRMGDTSCLSLENAQISVVMDLLLRVFQNMSKMSISKINTIAIHVSSGHFERTYFAPIMFGFIVSKKVRRARNDFARSSQYQYHFQVA